jgi:hypothetical protein
VNYGANGHNDSQTVHVKEKKIDDLRRDIGAMTAILTSSFKNTPKKWTIELGDAFEDITVDRV